MGTRRIRTVAHVSTQPAGATETAYAVEQKQHLVKTLGRFDMIFFTVAVIVGLDLIGQAASNGTEAITWAVILTVLFLLPYGLVMAEVGSAFTAEGGPYEWVKLTMGRFWAGLNTIFYWVTNPLWIGGSLAFIATEAWSQGISDISSGGFWDYAFKFLFIWVSISSAIISFKIGKWIPTLGAILKVAMVCVFAVTVVIYGIENGFQGIDTGGLSPTAAGLLGIAPLLLFSFVGFEGQNGAAEEMKNPQKDVPSSIMRSGALAAFCYLVPIFLVLLVLPADAITGIGGFLDAVKESYTIYGGARRRALRHHRDPLHLHAHELGRLVDDVRRPRARGRGGGRHVLPVLRGLPPEARDPAAGQHALRRDRDGVHGGRGAPAVRRRGRRVRRRAEHRHLDDAHLLHPRVPERVPAAQAVPEREPAVPRRQGRLGRAAGVRRRSSRSGSRSARGRRCSPGRSTSCSA